MKKNIVANIIILSLVLIAFLISFFALRYSLINDLVTAFGDSKAHLNIARRTFDSPTTGFSQLGTYWLPSLHLLMMPSIWSDKLWQTGLSGSIPNLIAYVLITVYSFKLSQKYTNSNFSGLVGALVVLLNPNLVYMAVTPMTEVLFTLTLVGTVYHYYSWVSEDKIHHLFFAAIWAFTSSLTRYEGWAVVALSSFLIGIQWIKSRMSHKWEGRLVLYSVVAWLGVLLWVMWGAILVNDPLDFMNNSMSAKNQTKEAYDLIQATGVGDILMANLTNILAFKHIVGYPALVVTGLLLFIYLFKHRKKLLNIDSNFIFIFLAPYLFDVLTVYLGNVPVEVPELSMVPSPGNYFNIRYAIFSIPLLSFVLGSSLKNRWIKLLLLFVTISSYVSIILPGTILVTLRDAGSVGLSNSYAETVDWFKKNYDGGLVLASTGAADGFMYDVGYNLANYVVEGSYKVWDKSIKNPEENVTWIITDSGNIRDAVNKKINHSALDKYYHVAYQKNTFRIYKLN